MPEDVLHLKRQVDVAIVGSGPTGLMAAEIAAKAGRQVVVFDRMRQPGRKFLLAGSDGLNLSHAEPLPDFIQRYDQPTVMQDILSSFRPDDLRAWAQSLAQETFVGSSGRIFPTAMKASPLLRAWLSRLETLGVTFVGQQSLTGWDQDSLHFGDHRVQAQATVLALGGASWPRFGTDGHWQSLFPNNHLQTIRPSNCRFPLDWSRHLIDQHDGSVIKNVAVEVGSGWRSGDIRIVKKGLEGAPIYAASNQWQSARRLHIDLMPGRAHSWLQEKWSKMPAKLSLSARLKRLNLKPATQALVQEARHRGSLAFPQSLKALPLQPDGDASFDRAISTSGGVRFDQLDDTLRYAGRDNTYLGGEMLDWDAPTGGYLLQACFSMGHRIGTALAHQSSGQNI